MTVSAMQDSEDPMIILACVILLVMFIVTVASASLWFCNCCSQKPKPPRNRSNHYSLSMRNGCEFDNPQGTFIRNALTAQLSPSIRVTSDSIGTLNRSTSYEVCGPAAFSASPSLDSTVHVAAPAATKASTLLASLVRRLASLGGRRQHPLDADFETSVDRELGASPTEGKFDSLVLSMQWSDLTEPEASPDDDGDPGAVMELVRPGMKLVLHDAPVADSCPTMLSPDAFSFKSFGSDQSFYSVDDADSNSALFRSCSYDGIPQSARRSSCL